MGTLTVITVLIIGAFIALISVNVVKEIYDRRILSESKAISSLRAVNGKYDFHDVSPMYFEHSYDNESYYDMVTEEDYLVEKLTHIAPSVSRSIQCVEENRRKFDAYKRDVGTARVFGLESKYLFANYASNREMVLFEKMIKRPDVIFHITVRLHLTNINGARYWSKEDKFSIDDIKYMISCVSEKRGDFYRDPRVWDSICRVERAKVSNRMRFSIYERDGNRCRKCGSTYDLEIDHIFPISKGGKSVYDNLQTLCHDCNRQKSNTVEKSDNPRYNTHGFYCPNCQIRLVMREGKYGKFYGCPNFPNCKYTKNL